MKKTKVFRDWKKVFADWQASGMDKDQYCQQQGINISLFTRQLRANRSQLSNKLSQRKNSIKRKTSKKASPSEDAKKQVMPGFVEILTQTPEEKRFLRITTPSGCVVEVPL